MNDGLKTSDREAIRGVLAQFSAIQKAVLFGSRATSTYSPASDIDLVLYGDSLALSDEFLIASRIEDLGLPFRVDLVRYSTITSKALLSHIHRQGKLFYEVKGGRGSEWREAVLGDLVDFHSGGTPAKENDVYWNGSIPWVSAKDMKRLFLDDAEDHVTEEGLRNGTKLAPASTVLLLTRGMTLLNDVPICIVRRPMAFNQDVKALRPKRGIRAEFLPYLLLGNKQRLLNLVDLAGHGTGRLNTDELKNLDVLVPPESEQRAIAHILGTLDDKIDLNRRMNETLEAMARALFKSWFVDFDPVRAKAEGHDPGLPKPLADLFPDSFEDSELGEIPKGWEVKPIGDFIQRLPVGHKYEQKTVNLVGKVPVLDQGKSGVIGYHDATPGVVASADSPVVVFANHTCYMRLVAFPFSAIQNVLPFIGKCVDTLWAFYASDGKQVFIEYKGHWPDFVIHKVVVPSSKLTTEFAALVHPLVKLTWARENEIKTITALRDTLLPKLMSGELRVKDVERLVAETAS